MKDLECQAKGLSLSRVPEREGLQVSLSSEVIRSGVTMQGEGKRGPACSLGSQPGHQSSADGHVSSPGPQSPGARWLHPCSLAHFTPRLLMLPASRIRGFGWSC